MLTEKIIVDDRDSSAAPFAAQTLRVVRQTNGVLRIHAANGGYLFSLIRTLDGKVYLYQDGYGCDWRQGKWSPVEVKF